MPYQEFNPDIKVNMPRKVFDQIKYLCSKIAKVEWSGILFYSVKGDITDPENFRINLEDILPMDKGTSAYTEYELDKRFVDYMMDNPEAMDWKVGHIHSHNTMGVFFSGTDKSELNDNAVNHNYYLSLIVNNFMEFEAKVAYVASTKVEQIEIEYKALNSAGEEYIVGIIPAKIDQKILCVHDCEIKSPSEKIKTTDSFMKKVSDILKPKQSAKPKYGNRVYNPVTKAWELVKDVEPHHSTKAPVIYLPENPLKNPNLNEDLTDAEIFAMTLLNFTNPPDATDTIDSLLDMVEVMHIQAFELAQSVSANYNTVYEQLFEDETSSSHYLEMLGEVIEEMEHYVTAYTILEDTISTLRQIENQYFEADSLENEEHNLIEG